jgi:hypothetical protein
MITAKEAKELYDESGAEVEQFLSYNVEQKVMDAANGGKRSVTIHLGSKDHFSCLAQLITPLQKAVVEKLKELGYQVVIKADGEFYVPRGLADDDGNGPKHQNYGIQISW